MKKKLKLISQILVLLLLVGIIFSSTVISNAGVTTTLPIFGNPTVLWEPEGVNLERSRIGNKDNYPIKEDQEKFTNAEGKDEYVSTNYSRLSFDILFGTSRQIMTYVGEIPKKVAESADGASRVPHAAKNHKFADPDNYANDDQRDYWGQNANNYFKENQVDDISDIEKYIDDTGANGSLRLYALTKTNGWGGRIGEWFAKGLYSVLSAVADLAKSVVNLFVQVKNIDILHILKLLNLKDLVEVFNKIFIGTKSRPSIFVLFALAALIFAFVAYAIRWLRGSNRKGKRLRDILLFAIVGVILVGMAMFGNTTSFATAVSNVVSTLMSDTADAITNVGSNTNLWKIEQQSGSTTSSTVSYNEMRILNKAFIDAQLLTQFGVEDIDDLKLGGRTQAITTFDGNLGYYFWYACSAAPDVPNGSTNFTQNFRSGDYYSGDRNERMKTVLTYMQRRYTASDDATKAKIEKMLVSLTKPAIGKGIFFFLFMAAIMILLCLVVFKLVIRVVLAKLLVAGSVLGIPIAGPLMLTGQEKLAGYGKMVLFVAVCFSIQIIILSVIFDLIFYVVATLMQPKLENLIICLILLIVLLKLMPMLIAKLDKLFTTINNKVGGPELTNAVNSAKQWGRRKVQGFNSWTNNRTRTKRIKNADGSYSEVQVQGGGVLGALGAMAANQANDYRNRKSALAVTKQLREKNKQQKIQAASQIQDESKVKEDSILSEVSQEKAALAAAIYGDKAHTYDNIEKEELSTAELKKYEQIKQNEEELAQIKDREDAVDYDLRNNVEISEARKKQHEIDQIRRDELNELINEKKAELQNDINERVNSQVNDAYAEDVRAELQKVIDNNTKAIDSVSHNNRRLTHEELRRLQIIAADVALSRKRLDAINQGLNPEDVTEASAKEIYEEIRRNNRMSKQDKVDFQALLDREARQNRVNASLKPKLEQQKLESAQYASQQELSKQINDVLEKEAQEQAERPDRLNAARQNRDFENKVKQNLSEYVHNEVRNKVSNYAVEQRKQGVSGAELGEALNKYRERVTKEVQQEADKTYNELQRTVNFAPTAGGAGRQMQVREGISAREAAEAVTNVERMTGVSLGETAEQYFKVNKGTEGEKAVRPNKSGGSAQQSYVDGQKVVSVQTPSPQAAPTPQDNIANRVQENRQQAAQTSRPQPTPQEPVTQTPTPQTYRRQESVPQQANTVQQPAPQQSVTPTQTPTPVQQTQPSDSISRRVQENKPAPQKPTTQNNTNKSQSTSTRRQERNSRAQQALDPASKAGALDTELKKRIEDIKNNKF